MSSQELIKTSFNLDENLSRVMESAIELAIEEDLGITGNSDITTDSIVDEKKTASADITVKQKAVLAGLAVVESLFLKFDSTMEFERFAQEGEEIDSPPSVVLKINGLARAILKGERLALNLLQRMSGVATITRSFWQKSKAYGIEILDTRKTTPCLRAFERLAVIAGGGVNHRSGLYDQFLIKDNHIMMAGSVSRAIDLARKAHPEKKIEIETRNLDEVQEAVLKEADIILLDNMSPAMVKEAVGLVSGRARIEISGGITSETIDGYFIEGVDAISIGALTHSAKAIDIGLDIVRVD